MSRANPMSGIAHIVALKNALERNAEYDTPPRTGGTQVSIRLDEFLYNHVETIVDRARWNRGEVLTSLIQRGLFDLYEICTPATVDTLVQDIVKKLPLEQPAVTAFVIENEAEADDLLRNLFEKPGRRSMSEITMWTTRYCKDEHIKRYMINKWKEMLDTYK